MARGNDRDRDGDGGRRNQGGGGGQQPNPQLTALQVENARLQALLQTEIQRNKVRERSEASAVLDGLRLALPDAEALAGRQALSEHERQQVGHAKRVVAAIKAALAFPFLDHIGGTPPMSPAPPTPRR
ncbi:MAG: hypothetical protein Q7T01_02425 [bacterium]|nr:hypothetical protein [bacterium]